MANGCDTSVMLKHIEPLESCIIVFTSSEYAGIDIHCCKGDAEHLYLVRHSEPLKHYGSAGDLTVAHVKHDRPRHKPSKRAATQSIKIRYIQFGVVSSFDAPLRAR